MEPILSKVCGSTFMGLFPVTIVEPILSNVCGSTFVGLFRETFAEPILSIKIKKIKTQICGTNFE